MFIYAIVLRVRDLIQSEEAYTCLAHIFHIGVGFCVARSTEMDNAKASKSGTSDWYRLPRFSFLLKEC